MSKSKSDVQLVRYKQGKFSFEIMTKPGTVRLFLEGKLGWDKVLSADAIFTNAKKGNIAKSSDLTKVFGTDDVNKCAEIMVRQGDHQVSAQERKEDISQRKREILAYLHKTYTDQTGLPHPLTRLEVAVTESKVKIDLSRSVHVQAEEIVKKMLGVLVFRKGTSQYSVSVPKQYRTSVGAIVNKFSPSLHKEIRGADNITWKMSLSLGDVDRFLLEMNSVTEGNFTLEKIEV